MQLHAIHGDVEKNVFFLEWCRKSPPALWLCIAPVVLWLYHCHVFEAYHHLLSRSLLLVSDNPIVSPGNLNLSYIVARLKYISAGLKHNTSSIVSCWPVCLPIPLYNQYLIKHCQLYYGALYHKHCTIEPCVIEHFINEQCNPTPRIRDSSSSSCCCCSSEKSHMLWC